MRVEESKCVWAQPGSSPQPVGLGSHGTPAQSRCRRRRIGRRILEDAKPASGLRICRLRFSCLLRGVRVDGVDLSLKSQRLQRVRERDLAQRLDPVMVAVFAAAVSAAGAALPSLWFDEAATISASANRSLTELWRLLDNIDAVHGLYYFVMHGWFAIFPATEFWSRLSSCLAVGGAAAWVVVLGKQLSTRSVAVCAGIAFAILPRITWAGIETRSYALSALAAVWLTVLLVSAIRQGRPLLWTLYGLGLVVSTLLNVFGVLMVPVHFVVVAILADKRSTVVRWAALSAVAVPLVAPFLVFCRTQITQVRWISPLNWHTIVEIVQEQYFDHSVPFAILAGVVLAAPIVLPRSGIGPSDVEYRRLAAISVAWMALPTAVLLGYSLWLEPIYYPRYLCYTSPAMALLLGVCIVAVAQSRERIAAAARRVCTCRDTELPVPAAWSVRQGRHGLQPGRRRRQPPRRAG